MSQSPSVGFLTPEERHDGHRRAVLLMVVVERIVPPASVALLQGKKQVRQMVLKVRPLGRGQFVDAERRVPVAIIIEVAGDEEERLMRNGLLAAKAQPAVAGKEPVEPHLEYV